ncbi:MAG: hypothetical protein QOK31_423, partial [Solirubrobacteraceae bacterium]|nr:hypothetical protein [Solirubrobacteraceae bacterium]
MIRFVAAGTVLRSFRLKVIRTLTANLCFLRRMALPAREGLILRVTLPPFFMVRLTEAINGVVLL